MKKRQKGWKKGMQEWNELMNEGRKGEYSKMDDRKKEKENT